MSKQAKAKETQQYTRTLKTCANCKHFNSKKEMGGWNGKYEIESELRCGVGGFKVHKTATCSIHENA